MFPRVRTGDAQRLRESSSDPARGRCDGEVFRGCGRFRRKLLPLARGASASGKLTAIGTRAGGTPKPNPASGWLTATGNHTEFGFILGTAA
jgi:hypothetical protein